MSPGARGGRADDRTAAVRGEDDVMNLAARFLRGAAAGAVVGAAIAGSVFVNRRRSRPARTEPAGLLSATTEEGSDAGDRP